jgi:hypothetical protein
LAIVGGFCVAGILAPWAGRGLALGATLVIFATLAIARIRAHAAYRAPRASDDAYAVVERIRRARAAEYEKRRPRR